MPPDDKTVTERAPQFRPANSGWVYGLVFSTGAQSGQGVVLSADRMQIGREVGNEIRLTDDTQVSRRHAELLRMPNGDYEIRDLGSSNGVYVNQKRIASGQLIPLREHDEVRVGQSTFALRRVGARVV
jgi:pSer/pThr/pTyr-binding forkhead associated (FHA) protein